MFHLIQSTLSTIFHYLTASYFQQTPGSDLSSRTMKNIVILGGSFAGISSAHRILKQAGKSAPLKITLVSPNTHFYWSMAAARGLVPGQISDEDLFRPIAEGFKQYPVFPLLFLLFPLSNSTLLRQIDSSSLSPLPKVLMSKPRKSAFLAQLASRRLITIFSFLLLALEPRGMHHSREWVRRKKPRLLDATSSPG